MFASGCILGCKIKRGLCKVCVDMLVPKDHLLRKIDAAVNFTRIYDLVALCS